MTAQECEAWRRETAKSSVAWRNDPIHSDAKDCLFYKGGESGVYVHIVDNVIHVGNYEGAFPHIGEALFVEKGRKVMATNDTAHKRVIEGLGVSFLTQLLYH